jgi:hypothetical protein
MEAEYVTSSIGEIAFLLWKGIYPDAVTFPPHRACIYFKKSINWGEITNSYWMGEKIPVCELSECIVVAKRILESGEIEDKWYKELREAIEEVRQDYVFPVM